MCRKGRYTKKILKRKCLSEEIRTAYKLWVMTSSPGYIVQLDPYQGVKRSLDITKGLGYGVVKNLESVLPPHQPFHVTCYNFFATFDLMKCLTKKVIAATETVRKNRLRDYPMDITSLKSEERFI